MGLLSDDFTENHKITVFNNRYGFEFLFVRLAPIVFLTSVVGVVVTYKKR